MSNPIQFNNWIKIQLNRIQIELKTNGMQIGGKNIKILLGNTVLNFFSKKHKFEKTPFYASSPGNGLNKFQFEIIQSMTTYRI
jgi:hypothetical protein